MLVEGTWTWAETDGMALQLGMAKATGQACLGRLVDEMFDRIWASGVGRGRVFVVKPNFGFATDERGGTTSLGLLAAVLDKIRRDHTLSKIYVVESDGIAFRCEEVFEFLGLGDLCARYQARLVNLSRLPRIRIRFPSCRLLKEIELPSLLISEEPILINLAKIKTHEIAKFSGAIKNLYGLNPYIFKVEYHPFILDVLCDIYQIFKPALTLVDGLWAVNGHGPWTGQPVRLGILVASDNALAADLAALHAIGWHSSAVPYIAQLAEDLASIEQEIGRLVPAPMTTFHWVPPSRPAVLKERLARIVIPLLKLGVPLVFPSGNRLKIARYGKQGMYCRSIVGLGSRSWSKRSARK